MSVELRQFDSTESLRDAFFEALSAELFAARTEDYAIMISGGNTPLPVYARIAALGKRCNRRCRIIFSDDRHVARDSTDSNYGNASAAFAALDIDDSRIYGIDPRLELTVAANDFDRRLNELMKDGIPIGTGFLGLGADGHTCSLFSIADAERDDVSAFAVKNRLGFDRITVSRRVLNSVKRLIVLVSGVEKEKALSALLDAPVTIPAGIAIGDHADVEVWSDVSIYRKTKTKTK